MLKDLKAFLKSPLDLARGEPLTKTITAVGIFVILGAVPLLLSAYYLRVLSEALMWTALAVSWHFFSGSTKYISLGSAAFVGIGLYFSAKFMALLSFPVTVVLGSLICFLLALGIGLITLRLRGIYFVIITFAVAMVVQNLIQWWEIKVTGTRGTYFSTFDNLTAYYVIFVCIIVTLLLTTLLRRSKFGLGLKMIGENEEAAAHVGVNANIYKTLGFAISAMLMGLMGGCLATRAKGYINTDIAFDMMYSFMPAAMALFGGLGSVYGPIIGAATISFLSSWLSVTYVRIFRTILGLVLIAVVMVMPNGIMGMVEKIKTKGLSGSIREIARKIKTTKLLGSKKAS
jgi:branched-chain amino acid transport system permease protein